MLIDWFTISAQILNFLVLVWLMKRFLYKPILSAIETREKKIADEIASADAIKIDAQKEHEEFQNKNAEFDRQRAEMMTKVADDAKVERERLLDDARKAADELTTKRQDLLRSQAQDINEAVTRRARQEVFAISRKALSDLANASLEERMGEVFTRKLREMAPETRSALGEAIRSSGSAAVVKSAFAIGQPQREAIQNALNETFSRSVELRFETSPELVSGIELTVNGQKLGWSIDEYLTSLEKEIDDILAAKSTRQPADRAAEAVSGSK